MTTTCLIGVDVLADVEVRDVGTGWALTAPAVATAGTMRAAAPAPASARRTERFMGSPVTIGKRPGVPGTTLMGRGKSTPGRSGTGLPDAPFKDCLPKLRPVLVQLSAGSSATCRFRSGPSEFASGCNDPLPVVVFPTMKSSTPHAQRGPVRPVPALALAAVLATSACGQATPSPGAPTAAGGAVPIVQTVTSGPVRLEATMAPAGLAVSYRVTNTGAQPLLAYDVVPQDLGSATLPTGVDVATPGSTRSRGCCASASRASRRPRTSASPLPPSWAGTSSPPVPASVGGRMPRRRRSWTCRENPSRPNERPWTPA